MDQAPVTAILDAIDAVNAKDPERDDGLPRALRYGRRMSATLEDFVATPSPHLRIACRGQHIERWMRPRADFPAGKAGYLRWRTALKRFHAERVAGLMADAGWDEADRARVGTLIRKEGLGRDPEVQTLEDVVCLVFFRYEAAAFAARHPVGKVLEIVAKTGRKMSPEGRAAALALGLDEPVVAALTQAA